MINSRFITNFICILLFALIFYLTYYLLLQDNIFHLSISSIIAYSHHLAIQKRLLVVGLLPIYIGLMIFGAAILGIFLCSIVQNKQAKYLFKTLKSKTQFTKKQIRYR